MTIKKTLYVAHGIPSNCKFYLMEWRRVFTIWEILKTLYWCLPFWSDYTSWLRQHKINLKVIWSSMWIYCLLCYLKSLVVNRRYWYARTFSLPCWLFVTDLEFLWCSELLFCWDTDLNCRVLRMMCSDVWRKDLAGHSAFQHGFVFK